MSDAILVLNSGSSSIKFALFGADAAAGRPFFTGKIERIGTAPVFAAQASDGSSLDKGALLQITPETGHDALIALLLDWIDQNDDAYSLVMAGHRVVHGGAEFIAPTVVTPDVLAQLDLLSPLAPLHQPHNLKAIRAISALTPDLPQIACFDTSFHRTQPHLNQMFAIPRHLTEAGILRFGFHGLSYDYIASVLPEHLGDLADGRIVVAHLGNGASMCAMLERQSVATTMGFTALHGLMMGRRTGTLDCGVVLHMIRALGMTPEQVEHVLYEQSGLLGVSGISSDMRVLLDSIDARAEEAVDLFCYRAASELAGLVAALGGLDAIVFTAGIGEHSAEIRKRICSRLSWLGVELNEDRNIVGEDRISAASSTVAVHVIPTNEVLVVARAARRILASFDQANSI